MGKHITEKQADGEFICEFVDEVLPLGKDRKTITVPLPPVEKLKSQIDEMISHARNEGLMMAGMIMNVMTAKYGDEAWKEVEKVMYDYGYQRAKEIADGMKIDLHDARSVGRIFDLEDSQFGIKGEWVETGKKRAVKRELYCPSAGMLLCPEICTRIGVSTEKGTLDALGVKGKFSFGKMVPKGDPYCEVILELED